MTVKLVIDRTRWLRGEGASDSYLLRVEDGKMCCLGFYCLQLGYKEVEIEHHSTPAETPAIVGDLDIARVDQLRPLLNYDASRDSAKDTDLCNELTRANDQPGTPLAEREAVITELFAQIGVEVEFIN